MLKFNGVNEDVSSGGSRILPGIHHVKMTTIELVDLQTKDGKAFQKGVVTFDCIKTLEGKNSEGRQAFFDIMIPTSTDPEELKVKFEKFMKRIIHMFNKTKGAANVEAINGFFSKLEVADLPALVKVLKDKFEGSEIKLKIKASAPKENGKQYSEIPMYTSGVCACVDEPKNTLRFDPATEDFKPQDSTKVESTSTEEKMPWE